MPEATSFLEAHHPNYSPTNTNKNKARLLVAHLLAECTRIDRLPVNISLLFRKAVPFVSPTSLGFLGASCSIERLSVLFEAPINSVVHGYREIAPQLNERMQFQGSSNGFY